MLSVGEVMAIGRSFEEAIQKAVRMVSGGQLAGLDGSLPTGSSESVHDLLKRPNDKRLWAIQFALETGWSIDEVHCLSKIDRWFLSKLSNIARLKMLCREKFSRPHDISSYDMRILKAAGFSDRQLASYTGSTELVVRKLRHAAGIVPFTKKIDTLAAEFPAHTNYMYMTYNGSADDDELSHTEGGGVIVLGCGAYCIGSSVEFDWCAVSAVREVRASKRTAVVINYNPETVSTDFDESDKLYFEELTLERVLDIYDAERSMGIVVSVGGQVPNNLALPLHMMGARILGTAPDDIDRAEDRHKFSVMLDAINVDQPAWQELRSKAEAFAFAAEVGFPVRKSISPTIQHPSV